MSADKIEEMGERRPPLISSHILVQKAPEATSPRIKQAGLEPYHSFKTGTKCKNAETYTATTPYALMAVVRNSAQG